MTAKVIKLLKHGKELVTHCIAQYLFLLMLAKLFKEIYVKRLQVIVKVFGIIPNYQMSFRSKHATIKQVNRVYRAMCDSF